MLPQLTFADGFKEARFRAYVANASLIWDMAVLPAALWAVGAVSTVISVRAASNDGRLTCEQQQGAGSDGSWLLECFPCAGNALRQVRRACTVLHADLMMRMHVAADPRVHPPPQTNKRPSRCMLIAHPPPPPP